MNLALLLFALRIISALLLLLFLGGIAWLIYQDMRVTAVSLTSSGTILGHLRVVAGEAENPAVGTLFPLLQLTTIGRAGNNTIVLEDNFVSNAHVMITRRGNQWWLEDLGSSNGTYLNEILLDETAVISAGDIIAVGGTQLKLELAA